jgi:hypothetical protein
MFWLFFLLELSLLLLAQLYHHDPCFSFSFQLWFGLTSVFSGLIYLWWPNGLDEELRWVLVALVLSVGLKINMYLGLCLDNTTCFCFIPCLVHVLGWQLLHAHGDCAVSLHGCWMWLSASPLVDQIGWERSSFSISFFFNLATWLFFTFVFLLFVLQVIKLNKMI